MTNKTKNTTTTENGEEKVYIVSVDVVADEENECGALNMTYYPTGETVKNQDEIEEIWNRGEGWAVFGKKYVAFIDYKDNVLGALVVPPFKTKESAVKSAVDFVTQLNSDDKQNEFEEIQNIKIEEKEKSDWERYAKSKVNILKQEAGMVEGWIKELNSK